MPPVDDPACRAPARATNLAGDRHLSRLQSARLRRSLVVGLLALAFATRASSDVLLPAWEVVVDAAVSLHLAISVLAIETLIARRVLGLSALRTLLVVGVSNAASTAAGLPLATLVFWRGMRSVWHPRGDPALFGLLLLCLPCCLLSIWIETHVARRLVPAAKRPLCRPWAVEANAASYFTIACVLAILLVVMEVWRRQGLII